MTQRSDDATSVQTGRQEPPQVEALPALYLLLSNPISEHPEQDALLRLMSQLAKLGWTAQDAQANLSHRRSEVCQCLPAVAPQQGRCGCLRPQRRRL